jgi:hypothetical protein
MRLESLRPGPRRTDRRQRWAAGCRYAGAKQGDEREFSSSLSLADEVPGQGRVLSGGSYRLAYEDAGSSPAVV